VRGGWDWDALGKFFRRRRRPLLFRQILEQIRHFSTFLIRKFHFWDIFDLEGRFLDPRLYYVANMGPKIADSSLKHVSC
jgi:hypothetical protein